MIKHIVCWKLKEENKEENCRKIKQMLEDLIPVIKEIKSLEVGVNFNFSENSFDLCLVSEFESAEDLEKYKVNENHVKVSKFVRSVIEDRISVDYNICLCTIRRFLGIYQK